ncbi:MAG: hypothetical protein IT355_06770 [Gemmatimonadaceae bacterium]|nr:hypothetical protein [Gemmatimonadaceae bacterium]
MSISSVLARLRRLEVLAVSTLTLAACGGGGGGGPTGGGTTGSMSASIDGTSWSSTTASATATPGGIFTLTGVQAGSGVGVTMTIYHIGAPGTYPLGVGSTVAGGLASVVEGTSGWSTPLSGAAGTVTVTSVSPTRIGGSFAFTAPRVTGASGLATRAITTGLFDVPVSGPATLVVPDNAGGKMTWGVGSTAHTASSIASVSAPSAGVLTFAGSNTAQTLSIIVSEYTGTGIYILGSGASRSVRLTQVAPGGVWGGTNASTTGSLTVTTATASRIIGSLSVTLQPVGGTTGGTVRVFATFDIGI